MLSYQRFAAIFCLVCSMLGFAWADKAQDALVEQVEWLEEQASLVHSARCEFRVTGVPTRSGTIADAIVPSTLERAEIARLRPARRPAALRQPTPMVFEDQEISGNYHALWWRKGNKEREEREERDFSPTMQLAAPIVQAAVIDGEFVRTLNRGYGRVYGAILPMEPARMTANRLQPYAFAFEYGLLSHAQIIRRSTPRQVTKGKYLGRDRLEVLVEHSWLWGGKLLLAFDAEHRLVQRDVLTTSQRTANYILLERHEFLDHKPYDNGSGRRIWFPSEVILSAYTRETPVVQHVTIERIEFNVGLADEQFSLEFPQDADVYDGVKQRWIPQPKPIVDGN